MLLAHMSAFKKTPLLLLVLAACDLNMVFGQVTATKLTVATLLATSPIELKPAAIAGLDASIPDAGFAFDAGFLLDAGFVVPAQTIASVYFGERDARALDAPPTALTGAVVTLTAGSGVPFALAESGQGLYVGSSDGGLAYQSNVTYTFALEYQGARYTAVLENAPALERSEELHPSAGFVELQAGTDLTFNRPTPPMGQERNIGFVTVVPIGRDGQRGEPTYSNVPRAPLDFLSLIVSPAKWRETSVTVPGTAFPEANRNYLVLFQSAKLGKATSNNLFAGSAIIGGTADVGIIKTRP
jgi:hypothetical protein